VTPDVLLINANVLKPAVAPIGLDYIADSLRAAGFEARLLDLCFESNIEGAIASALEAGEPALVGLTLRNTDDCFLASGKDFLPGFAEIVRLVREQTSAPVASRIADGKIE
jgi:hypothetical protein